nr:MATE family efflux transporter [uncultured Dialister sp.]
MNCYDRHYLKIALPAALEGLFMILLASTDLILVGALGSLSVAAVSIFLQPRLILLCFSRSLASAVTLVSCNYAGRGEKEPSADLLKKSLFLGALALGLLHGLFYLFLKDIFILMGASPDYLPQAMEYGPLALLAVYFTSLTLILQAVQLGYGDTASIMKTNICGNLLNAALSFLLIRGLGPVPAYGVLGAAIGTAAGTLFSLLYSYFLLRRKGFFHGGQWIPDMAYFKKVGPLFGSVLSEQGSERIGMVLFSRMAAGLGTVPFAVHSICMNICDIYYDFIMGFGKAGMVTAGQAVGRGSGADWQQYRKTGLRWCMILSTAACGSILFFSDEIFSIYSPDPSLHVMAAAIMIFIALVSYPEAIALWGAGILRGSGQTAQVAAYSFVSITFLRPLMTAFFIYVLDMGLIGTWCALLLDQVIRAACASFLVSRLAGKRCFLTNAG